MPVQFHFMTGNSNGLPLKHMRRVISQTVPGAVTHGFHQYTAYLARVDQSDLFLSPFPFGNTNGIVDAFTLGLPGVCKTGPEVFEHIDGALFERAGMPAWTTADTVEAYVQAAVRMITQHDEREALRRQLIETKAVEGSSKDARRRSASASCGLCATSASATRKRPRPQLLPALEVRGERP